MLTQVPENAFRVPAAGGARSATAVLADRASRSIVRALGEARGHALTAVAIADRSALDAAPRLIRDRVRELERSGILEPAPRVAANDGAAQRWVLSGAGQDLHRLQALMARIVVKAAGLNTSAPPIVREQVLEVTLSALSDPVVVQIARTLAGAGHPIDPIGLEEGCRPTPRRTIYRRLQPLVAAGVVVRTTTGQVPRSTHYSLAEQWRPAVAILALSAWWEWRHRAPVMRPETSDLEGLLLGILPIARIEPGWSGSRLQCVVDVDGTGSAPILEVEGARLRILEGADVDGSAELVVTRITGGPGPWTSALVTDQREGLTIEGDQALANVVLGAWRAALLTYLR